MSGETGSSATQRAHLWGIPTGRRPEPEDVTGLWSADKVETDRIASGCRHVLKGATCKACLRSPPQRPWLERRTSLPWVATPRRESMQTKPCALVFGRHLVVERPSYGEQKRSTQKENSAPPCARHGVFAPSPLLLPCQPHMRVFRSTSPAFHSGISYQVPGSRCLVPGTSSGPTPKAGYRGPSPGTRCI